MSAKPTLAEVRMMLQLRGASTDGTEGELRARLDGCLHAEQKRADDTPTASHWHSLAARLQRLVDDESVSDVTFSLQGELIHASRALLVASSEYFEAMLGPTFEAQHGDESEVCWKRRKTEDGCAFKEKLPGSPVVIEDVQPCTFRRLLRFLYTGQMEALDTPDVCDLLRVANMYCIPALMEACCAKLLNGLTADQCFPLLALVEEMPMATAAALQQGCLELLRQRPEQTVSTLEQQHVEEALRSLGVCTVQDVCYNISLGVAQVAAPERLVGTLVEKLALWAGPKSKVPPYGSPFRRLYSYASRLRVSDLLQNAHHCEGELTLNCVEDLPPTGRGSFSAFTLGQEELRFNYERSRIDKDLVGVYLNLLTPADKQAPPWWPVHLMASYCEPSRPSSRSRMCYVNRTVRRKESWGTSRFVKLSLLQEQQNRSEDVKLRLEAHCALNSIMGLCVAYAAFNFEPAVREGVLVAHQLAYLLELDTLSVRSEDEVLRTLLLLLEEHPYSIEDDISIGLEGLMSRCRWQFVTPHLLLNTLRSGDEAAGVLRKSKVARAAALWLLGAGGRPKKLCDRRRSGYDADIRDQAGGQYSAAALCDWLFSDVPQDAESGDTHVDEQ